LLKTLENVDRWEQKDNSLELYAQRRLVMRFTAPIKRAPVDPATAVGLEDKKWMLEAIDGVAVPKIARTAFVVFDKEKQSAGGDSSCNLFGGSYTVAGDKLKITDVVSTMRACIEDDRMKIEREFLDALQKTNRYEIVREKLMLYQNKRLLLTLEGEDKR